MISLSATSLTDKLKNLVVNNNINGLKMKLIKNSKNLYVSKIPQFRIGATTKLKPVMPRMIEHIALDNPIL